MQVACIFSLAACTILNVNVASRLDESAAILKRDREDEAERARQHEAMHKLNLHNQVEIASQARQIKLLNEVNKRLAEDLNKRLTEISKRGD